MRWEFKTASTLENRRKEGLRIRREYSDRVPTIVERAPHSHIPELTSKKFLVPNDLTVGQFYFLIRKRIQLPPENALFFFVNNTIPQTSMTMGDLYKQHADEDHFLKMTYEKKTLTNLSGWLVENDLFLCCEKDENIQKNDDDIFMSDGELKQFCLTKKCNIRRHRHIPIINFNDTNLFPYVKKLNTAKTITAQLSKFDRHHSSKSNALSTYVNTSNLDDEIKQELNSMLGCKEYALDGTQLDPDRKQFKAAVAEKANAEQRLAKYKRQLNINKITQKSIRYHKQYIREFNRERYFSKGGVSNSRNKRRRD
ncbi:unnamed protein product [Didymodactylos carnosus]|uniref:Uncharacterized protein n=1 Tax=Didymodactylos carnosus TaxID=1234261 RepID=A0A813YQK1_9BILA|nr:unnamed protein product [Didymodactylos carnosus]CAF0887648.1 unnamed protein product [Didymodactylos carnosus]CAF3525036.1 unnamed protein product [Didymodactylos carnosus]CAF3672583.1 unnamed protein product [Didymodactylos carnosus]